MENQTALRSYNRDWQLKDQNQLIEIRNKLNGKLFWSGKGWKRAAFGKKNRKLNNALNITQNKYSSTLKKLTVLEVKVFEAQEGLTQKLNHRYWQKTIASMKEVTMAINWKKQEADPAKRISRGNFNKWNLWI